MKTYICLQCTAHFDGDEIVAKHYDRATGTWDAEECPECGSEDFEEAGYCVICDDYYPIDNSNGAENYMIGRICKKCLEKNATRDNAFRFAWDYNIPHDALFGSSPDEAKEFCFEDEYAFSEWLENEQA